MINECLLENNYSGKYKEPLKHFPILPTRFTDCWEKEHEGNPCLKLISFLFHLAETTPTRCGHRCRISDQYPTDSHAVLGLQGSPPSIQHALLGECLW